MSCALCLALAAGPFPHNLYLLFYQQPGSIATSPAEPIRYRPSAIGNPCALCPESCAGRRPFSPQPIPLFYQQPGSIATRPAEPIRYRPSAIGNPCALCPLQCCQSAVVVRFLSNFRDKLGIFDFAFFVNNYYASGVKSCKGTVS
jgi:hypothetical protein